MQKRVGNMQKGEGGIGKRVQNMGRGVEERKGGDELCIHSHFPPPSPISASPLPMFPSASPASVKQEAVRVVEDWSATA